MSASRIIFVNRFYWPDEPATGQLLTDLAEELAGRGQAVFVITSGDETRPMDEVRAGVVIRRVRRAEGKRRSAWAKLMAWTGFIVGACWELRRILRAGDRLVLMTDPPLLPLLAGPIARRRRATVFHWVQDVYPELPERLLGLRGLGCLRSLRDREWRRAAAVAVLGSDMAALVQSRGVARECLHVLPNWAPRGLEPATAARIERRRRDWGLEGKFVLAYSGNFGRVHALDPILDLAAALRDDPAVVFLFIGGGAQQARLEETVSLRRLENVRFEPPQPRSELAVTLGAADVHFVTLHEQCADLVFPSKYYGILAVGRPLLYVGPANCELAQAITSHGIGGVFAPADVTAMAALLRTWRQHPELAQAMGQRARARHEQAGGPVAAANRWISLLNASATAKTELGLPASSS